MTRLISTAPWFQSARVALAYAVPLTLAFSFGFLFKAPPPSATIEVAPADLAERMPVAETGLHVGDAVALTTVLGKDMAGIRATRVPYESSAIGVVSTRPGTLLGAKSAGVAVALAGRVPVNVTMEGGPIAIGDYLVASTTRGRVMHARDLNRGGVLGIALTAYHGYPVGGHDDLNDGVAYEKGHQVLMLMHPGVMPREGLIEWEKKLEFLAKHSMLNATAASDTKIDALTARKMAETAVTDVTANKLAADQTKASLEAALADLVQKNNALD
ncbi:MAG: hypothetical protein NTZ90_08520, partial [Proteobacteria bacterium]|nr:hypothetical protein [Pseudomonadota bacterium]